MGRNPDVTGQRSSKGAWNLPNRRQHRGMFPSRHIYGRCDGFPFLSPPFVLAISRGGLVATERKSEMD